MISLTGARLRDPKIAPMGPPIDVRRRLLLAGLVLVVVACSRPRPQAIVVEPAVQALHERAFIADLHMDPVMHHRDLLRASDQGETDIPRLRQAGVDLAGFGIVTEPVPILGEAGIRLGFWWWGWPAEARRSPLARALAQLDAIDRLVEADPHLRVVRRAEDLDEVAAQHALGIVISLEGALAFADDPEVVHRLYQRGVRVVGLTHLRNNALGGSGSPTVPILDWYVDGGDRGLTDRGRAVLRAMAEHAIIVDLAHTSPRTFDDILTAWSGPVLVSHTGLAALHPGTRNLTDAQLRTVAARGGIVGVMIATNFLGGDHLSALADHLVHAVEVIGADHVSLGLDLDGMVPLPVEFHDVRDLPKVTQLLHERGLTPSEIEHVLGLNALRFFRAALAAS
jgi:membrane dipeptidase